MRQRSVALYGCLLLACGLGVHRLDAQPPTTSAVPAASAAPGVQFADEALGAGDRELLLRAAQTVGRWAMVQRVVKAVQARQASPIDAQHVQSIDQAWQRGEDPEGLATSLSKNDCAQALQSLVSANPGYAEAFATDAQGVLVCMTQRTTDYWQGDEENWTRAWADGSGATFVSKPELDQSTGLELVHISVPIKSGGRPIGVLIVGRIAAPPTPG